MRRFWEKVDKSRDCWIWTGALKGIGYGAFWINGKQVGAHRLSWEFHHGKIPDGMHVLHKCDVPSCVNPDHLFIGTDFDNHQDMDRKNRRFVAYGERHTSSKLKLDDVIKIQSDSRHWSAIAAEYNVSRRTIFRVRKRQGWIKALSSRPTAGGTGPTGLGISK